MRLVLWQTIPPVVASKSGITVLVVHILLGISTASRERAFICLCFTSPKADDIFAKYLGCGYTAKMGLLF